MKGAKLAQVKVQKFGSKLSGMVMPNIGVFIGWGLLAALFIDNGWWPNEKLAVLVDPIMKYLIPILIGYTAGYNIHGRRGGVIGAFATIGVVIGSEVPMLVGGMVMGSLAGWIIKIVDNKFRDKVKAGLEMLFDNFTIGIIGVILCILGYLGAAPVMDAILDFLEYGVAFMMEHYLLPLVAIFVQPAQILFLNNAVNHGILVPLGIQQAATEGVSPLFLVEANGGYWVGFVLAVALYSRGQIRNSAFGATAIEFLGGIAETCFPFCLMKPITIIGPICGNIFALLVLSIFGGGTVGPPSPGSVIMLYLMTPKDYIVINTVVYFGALLVSFFVTGLILKFSNKDVYRIEESKKAKNDAGNLKVEGHITNLSKVIFACDAGMGSSAMGCSLLRKKLMKAGLEPEVDHVAVANIPEDADLVVTNSNLADRAKNITKGKIPIIEIQNFMDDKEYNRIVSEIQRLCDEEKNIQSEKPKNANEAKKDDKELKDTNNKELEKNENKSQDSKPVFTKENIVIGADVKDKREAIDLCADILIDNDYVTEDYREDMHKRDADASVYVGNNVAMPHGLSSSKKNIKHSGICIVQCKDKVVFDGNDVTILIGVAGDGEDHVDILGKIGQIMCIEENIAKLNEAKTVDEIYELFNGVLD